MQNRCRQRVIRRKQYSGKTKTQRHQDTLTKTDISVMVVPSQSLPHYVEHVQNKRRVPRLTCVEEQVGWGPRLGKQVLPEGNWSTV